MAFSFVGRYWPLAVAVLACPAASQPASPAAPAAPVAWRSAFAGYQPFVEAPLTPWRESNDTVGRVGGWRAYAREAQGAALPAPAAGVEPTKPVAPAVGHRH